MWDTTDESIRNLTCPAEKRSINPSMTPALSTLIADRIAAAFGRFIADRIAPASFRFRAAIFWRISPHRAPLRQQGH
jgi:hypothetical protein